EFHTVDTVASRTQITLEAPLPEGLQQLAAIRVTIAPLDPETAERDSEWGFVLSYLEAELVAPDEDKPRPIKLVHVVGDEPHPHFPPQESINRRTGRGFAAYTRIHYPRQAAFVVEQPM